MCYHKFCAIVCYLYSTVNDYDIVNSLVTILNGDRSAVFHIDVEDDDIVEGIETFSLGLESGSVRNIDSGEVSTDNAQTVVFIEDNDGKLAIASYG